MPEQPQHIEPERPATIPQVIQSAVRTEPLPTTEARARLEERKLYGDASRSERSKLCLHVIEVAAIIGIGTLIVVVIGIRIAMMCLPTERRWLSHEELNSIDQFLSTGTIGGVLTQAIRKKTGGGAPPASGE